MLENAQNFQGCVLSEPTQDEVYVRVQLSAEKASLSVVDIAHLLMNFVSGVELKHAAIVRVEGLDDKKWQVLEEVLLDIKSSSPWFGFNHHLFKMIKSPKGDLYKEAQRIIIENAEALVDSIPSETRLRVNACSALLDIERYVSGYKYLSEKTGVELPEENLSTKLLKARVVREEPRVRVKNKIPRLGHFKTGVVQMDP